MTKTSLFTALLFCVATVQAQSQDDIAFWTSHFPLQVGQRWHYDSIQFPSTTQPWLKREVIGDTLLANGKRYFTIKNERPKEVSFEFARIDTLNLMVMSAGEHWSTSIDFVEGETPVLLLPDGSLERTLEVTLPSGDSYLFLQCSWGQISVRGIDYLRWTCTRDPLAYSSFSTDMVFGLGPVRLRQDYEGPPPSVDELRYTNALGYDQGVAVNLQDQVQIAGGDNFYVFPNPLSGNSPLYLNGVKLTAQDRVVLIDMLGRHYVPRIHSTGEHPQIELPRNLASGVYALLVDHSGMIRSALFVYENN